MEAQLKAAAEAVKAYVKKWEAVGDEMYKNYIAKEPEDVAKYTTMDADLAKLELAIENLEKVSALVNQVPMAAGAYRGSGAAGTSSLKMQLSTMERMVKEAKALKAAKPPAAPPKPNAAAKVPVAPKPNAAKPLPKPSPNPGRPLPKVPGKVNAYADPNARKR